MLAAIGDEDVQLAPRNARRVVLGKLVPNFAALTDRHRCILEDLVVDSRPRIGKIGDSHAVAVRALN